MARTRVRWGRLGGLVVTAALAVALAGGAARAGDADGPFPGAKAAAVRTYTVDAGDTVWGIARGLVGPEADPRPMVDRILQENALQAGDLQAGQTLVLPAP
jgi:Tfp pilus assembly protein FimV